MFCGILLYNVFAEVVTRAPGMVVGNPNYVKKLVFPVEVFVVAGLISALVNLLLGVGVWLIGWTILKAALPHWTLIYVPLVVLPVVLMTLGIGWTLASLGVFLRDVGHAVLLAVQMLFFLTPIFYRLDAVPQPWRTIIALNPLAHAVEDMRGVMMFGQPPRWLWWGVAVAASAVLAVVGYAFFMKSRRAFADVL
jgi:lipopolysaccharide transport system permease protein